MTDYFGITLTAIFTGIGVAIGGEVHAYLKERREKMKGHIKTIITNNTNWEEQKNG